MTIPVSGQASPLGNNLLPESLEETCSYLWATVTVLVTACMLPVVCKLCQRSFNFFCKKLFERTIKELDEKNNRYLQQIKQLKESKQKLEEENKVLVIQVNAYSNEVDNQKRLNLEEASRHKQTCQDAEEIRRDIISINDACNEANKKLRDAHESYKSEIEQMIEGLLRDHQKEIDRYREANACLCKNLKEAQFDLEKIDKDFRQNKDKNTELEEQGKRHDLLNYLLRTENDELKIMLKNLEETLKTKETKLKKMQDAQRLSVKGVKRIEKEYSEKNNRLMDEIQNLNDELQKFKAALLVAQNDLREAKSESDYNSLLYKGNQVHQYLKSENNKPLRAKPDDPDDKSIPENVLVRGVDTDIQYYADMVRRMSKNPDTEEVMFPEDNESSLPYDPNLVCPKCGKQYRVGEIQKLRRHMNEFCTGIR